MGHHEQDFENLLEKLECDNFAVLTEHSRQLVGRNRLTTDRQRHKQHTVKPAEVDSTETRL